MDNNMDIHRQLHNAIQNITNHAGGEAANILSVLRSQAANFFPLINLKSYVGLLEGCNLSFRANVNDSETNKLLSDKFPASIDVCQKENPAGIGCKAIVEGSTLIIHDIHNTADPLAAEGVYLDNETRSQFATPLLIEGQVIGVMVIEANATDVFTHEMKLALETLALVAAREVVRSYTSQAIKEINDFIHNQYQITEINEILKIVLDYCLLVTFAPYGGIGIVGADGAVRYDVAVRGKGYDNLPAGSGFSAYVVDRREKLIVKNVDDELEGYIYNRNHHDVKSELFYPIKFDKTVAYIINIQMPFITPNSTPFNPIIAQSIEEIAEFAASVMQNIGFIEHLKLLHNLADKLNSVGDEKELVNKIGEKLSELFQTQLTEQSTGNPVSVTHYSTFALVLRKPASIQGYSNPSEIVTFYRFDQNKQIEAGDRNLSELAQSQRLLDPTTSESEKHYHYHTREEAQLTDPNLLKDFESHIGVVIEVRGERIGIISLHAERQYAFTSHDVEIMTVMARHIGTALRSLRRYEESLDGLNQIDKMIVERDTANDDHLKKIYELITERACKLTDSQHSAIYEVRWNKNGSQYIKRIAAHGPQENEHDEFAVGDEHSLSALVANHGKPMRVSKEIEPNIWGKLLYPQKYHKTRSIVSVPLQVGKKIRGILTVRSENDLSRTDESMLIALAGQGAVAMQFWERSITLTKLTNTLHQSLTANNFQEITKKLLNFVIDLLDPSKQRNLTGTIRTLNVFTDSLDLLAYSTTTEEQIQYFNQYKAMPTNTGIVGKVVRERAAADPLNSERLRELKEEGVYQVIPNVKCQISVPIWGGSVKTPTDDLPNLRIINGVLTVFSPYDNALTENDKTMLIFIAEIIGVLWSEALLKQRTQVLDEISTLWMHGKIRTWEEFNVWEWIGKLYTPASDTGFQNASGTLTRYHRGKGVLVLEAHNNLKDPYEELPLKKGIQGWVARQNLNLKAGDEPIIANVPKVYDEDRKIMDVTLINRQNEYDKLNKIYSDNMIHDKSGSERKNTNSELCVPILDSENQLLGLLNVESPVPYAFDDSDAEILLTLAKQIANAVERIRGAWHEQAANHLPAQILAHGFSETVGGILGKINAILNTTLSIDNKKHIDSIKGTLSAMQDRYKLTKMDPSPENISIQDMLNRIAEARSPDSPMLRLNLLDMDYSVMMSKLRLETTIDDIINNVSKHNENRTDLEINVTVQYVDVTQMICIIISDNGSGIPNEIKPYIFDVGVSSKKDNNSNREHGNGLSLAKQSVEQAGGLIELIELPPYSTTFAIWLPVYQEP